MKKNFWLLLSAAMAMFCMASCSQDETTAEGGFEVELAASIEAPAYNDPQVAIDVPGTRTFLVEGSEYENGVGTWWSTKETIGVYSNNSKNVKFTSTNSKSAQSVSFSGWMFGTPKYAYYPYDSANSSSPYSAVKMTMPTTRSFNSTTKGLAADFYAGTIADKGWFSSTFNFKRLVAMWKIAVDATGTALEGAKLISVSVAVNNSRQISGDFTVDISNNEVTMGSFSEGDNTIEVNYTSNPVMYANGSYNAYATVMPNVQAGDELVFTVKSSAGTATFTTTAAVSQEANGFYVFPIVLGEMDIEVEEEETETDKVTSDYQITSMKFTVANNSGKILPRTFTHNSSFTVTPTDITAVECTIDQENQKITLYVPYLFNYQLIPTISTSSSDALLAYGQGLITSDETVVDFATYKQIMVGNEDGATVYDVEITNTGLPIVVINQKTGVTSEEANSKYQKASAAWYAATGTMWQPKDADWGMTEGNDNFMVYNANGTSALKDKSGNMVTEPILASTRVRGNVTQQMPKKPFAVKLDKKHYVLGMPAHKRWVLLANWKDRTLMRNSVAFAMAKTFKNIFPNDGMAWNPSGQFVELVYNGVHVGTYYLCEQIKVDNNRLAINDIMEDSSSTSPADYGILMESDDGYDEAWQFTTANYVPFLLKDDASDEVLAYAQNFVRGVEDNLYAGNYDAAFEKMDLSSFVDFWLIQELMMNSETAHPKSCYSYINNGKIYAGPLWDFDWNTLPTSSSYSENSYTFTKSMLEDAMHSKTLFWTTYKCYHKTSGYPSEPDNEGDKTYLWYPMLVKSDAFKAMAAERWNAVKAGLKADMIIHLDNMYAQLATSAAENEKMWPVDSGTSAVGSKRYSVYGIGGGFCGDESKSFKDAIEQLKTTISTRIDGMSYVSNQSWPSVTYGTK